VADLEFTFEIDGNDVTVIADEAYKDQPEALQAEALRLYQEQKRMNPEPSLGGLAESYGAAAEMGMEGLSSAAGGVASYPYGAYVTATEGEEAGKAAKKQLQESMTYEPGLEYTDILKTKIGEFVQPAVEAVAPYVEKGLTGIEESAKGAFAPLGEAASDTAGYLMRYLPQTALEALGLYGTGGMLKRGVQLKDAQGRPTKTLRAVLRKEGIEYDSLPVAVQQSLPDTVRELPFSKGARKRLATETAAGEVRSGSTQGGLAERMIDEGEGVSGRVKQGLFGEKMTEDPFGVDAVQAGWEPKFVQMVKGTDPKTRLKMFEMIKQRRAIEVDEMAEAKGGRPLAVAGKDLVDRYDFVREQSKAAAKRNNELVNSPEFKNQPFDTGIIDTRLDEVFDDLRLSYQRDQFGNVVTRDGVPQLDFKNSIIEVDPTAQRVMKNLMTIMSGKQPTMAEAHVLKRQIDGMVNYEQTASATGKITDKAEAAAKKLRAALNDGLRERFPEYADNNDVMSAFMDIEGGLRKGLGKNAFLKMQAEGSAGITGQQLRRLTSNVQSRQDLTDAIDMLTNLAAAKGGKFDVDLARLVRLDNALEKELGTVAKSGFQGGIEAGVGRGVGEALSRRGQMEMAGEAIDTLIKKAKGIDPSVQGKLDALERLTLRGL
jgi:hypothetical protein